VVVYTENDGEDRDFVRLCDTGQICIKLDTPTTITFCPVGGRLTFLDSCRYLRGLANDALDFYTDKKVMVPYWNSASTYLTWCSRRKPNSYSASSQKTERVGMTPRPYLKPAISSWWKGGAYPRRACPSAMETAGRSMPG
jgi:hypothetical protein